MDRLDYKAGPLSVGVERNCMPDRPNRPPFPLHIAQTNRKSTRKDQRYSKAAVGGTAAAGSDRTTVWAPYLARPVVRDLTPSFEHQRVQSLGRYGGLVGWLLAEVEHWVGCTILRTLSVVVLAPQFHLLQLRERGRQYLLHLIPSSQLLCRSD